MNEQPSPFHLGTINDLMNEIAALCDKYGYSQWFLAVGSDDNNDEATWQCTGNVKSEGLVELLRDHADVMQEELDNL